MRQGKQVDGRFAHGLIDAAVDMIRKRWQPEPAPAWVTCVPSLSHKILVPDYAKRLGEKLGIPFSECVRKTRDTDPQKLMQNSCQQLRNIDGAFAVDAKLVQPGAVLLIDDMVDSGWTMTLLAALLKSAGCGAVYPLALARVQIGKDS